MVTTDPDKALVQRLREGIRQSDNKMRSFREARVDALREYVGGRYGDNREATANPFNMIWSAASVFIPNLVAHNPRYRVRVEDTPFQFRRNAWKIQLDLNQTVRELDLNKTLRKIVIDSIFLVGIRKCGRVKTENGPELFFDRVSPDNYVVDPMARDFEEAMWEGDKFRVPVGTAQKMFQSRRIKATHIAPQPGQKAEALEGKPQFSETIPMTDIYEIYLPSEGVIVTFPDQVASEGLFKVSEWAGPDRGPYDYLYYHEAPDNLMPVAPAMIWQDLHDLINELGKKMKRQAERAKEVIGYEESAAADAENLQEADDGDIIAMGDPDKIEAFRTGGTDENEAAFEQFLIQMFSRVAGNVDMLGGLSSEASTATEAAKLDANANVRVADMTEIVDTFSGNAGWDLAWWRYNSQATRNVTMRVPDTNIEIPSRYNAQAMMEPFSEHKLEIVPYSMSIKQPERNAQRLTQWWNNMVLPTLNIAAQQGVTVDVPKFVQWAGEEMGLKRVEMDRFYKVMERQTATEQGPQGPQRPGGGADNEGQASPAEDRSRERAENTGMSQPNPDTAPGGPGLEEVMQGVRATRSN